MTKTQEMYRLMKRYVLLLAALLLIFGLSACTQENSAQPARNEQQNSAQPPENTAPLPSEDETAIAKVMDEVFESFKAVDPARAANCFTADSAAAVRNCFAKTPEGYMELLRSWTSGMKYNITDISIADDKAVATVQVFSLNASNVLTAAGDEYTVRAVALGQQQQAATQEKINALLLECLQHAAEKTSPISSLQDIGFPLMKTENGWKIGNFTPDMLELMYAHISKITGVFE